MLDIIPSPEAIRLHRILETLADLQEFRTMSFNLGGSYDILGGEGLSSKVRELILYLQKRNALLHLVEWLHQNKPDIEM